MREFPKNRREEGWENMDMEFSKEKGECEGLLNESRLNANAGKVLSLGSEWIDGKRRSALAVHSRYKYLRAPYISQTGSIFGYFTEDLTVHQLGAPSCKKIGLKYLYPQRLIDLKSAMIAFAALELWLCDTWPIFRVPPGTPKLHKKMNYVSWDLIIY